VKRQADGELLWGVIVETEAYSQEETACRGYLAAAPSTQRSSGSLGACTSM
jgi:DNA-3-methyladenine glycosylase